MCTNVRSLMCCFPVGLRLFNNFIVNSAVSDARLASPRVDIRTRLTGPHISYTWLVPQVAYFGAVTSPGPLLFINQGILNAHCSLLNETRSIKYNHVFLCYIASIVPSHWNCYHCTGYRSAISFTVHSPFHVNFLSGSTNWYHKGVWKYQSQPSDMILNKFHSPLILTAHILPYPRSSKLIFQEVSPSKSVCIICLCSLVTHLTLCSIYISLLSDINNEIPHCTVF